MSAQAGGLGFSFVAVGVLANHQVSTVLNQASRILSGFTFPPSELEIECELKFGQAFDLLVTQQVKVYQPERPTEIHCQWPPVHLMAEYGSIGAPSNTRRALKRCTAATKNSSIMGMRNNFEHDWRKFARILRT